MYCIPCDRIIDDAASDKNFRLVAVSSVQNDGLFHPFFEIFRFQIFYILPFGKDKADICIGKAFFRGITVLDLAGRVKGVWNSGSL